VVESKRCFEERLCLSVFNLKFTQDVAVKSKDMSYITRNHAMTASQSPRPACDDTHLPHKHVYQIFCILSLAKGGCTISTYYPRPTTQTKIYQAQASTGIDS
jgi:hypothetical protein